MVVSDTTTDTLNRLRSIAGHVNGIAKPRRVARIDSPAIDIEDFESYVVKWREENEQVMAILVESDGTETSMPLDDYKTLVEDVGQPFCTVEEGSIRICWHLDSRSGCIKIGN